MYHRWRTPSLATNTNVPTVVEVRCECADSPRSLLGTTSPRARSEIGKNSLVFKVLNAKKDDLNDVVESESENGQRRNTWHMEQSLCRGYSACTTGGTPRPLRQTRTSQRWLRLVVNALIRLGVYLEQHRPEHDRKLARTRWSLKF